jgi:hypothetical protein
MLPKRSKLYHKIKQTHVSKNIKNIKIKEIKDLGFVVMRNKELAS